MENLISLTKDGKEHTGIPTGLESKIFRAVDIGSLQSDPGWIYDDQGRMEQWKLEGVTEEEGQMVFYGPRIEGEVFSEEALTLERLQKMIRIFEALQEKKSSYRGFYSRNWVFLNDGRVLVLPVLLMDFIRKSEKEDLRIKNWYPFNHPDCQGVDGLSFTAAILTCSLFGQIHPYAPLETAEDNRNEQLRRPPSLTPDLLIPGINREAADLIGRSLSKERPTMREWRKTADTWTEDSVIQEISGEERKEIEEKAAQLLDRGEKNRNLRQTWRRKNTFYMVIAAIAITVALIAAAPIKRAMEPPLTMGMSDLEVVEAYYSSFNTMDQDLMDDCIDKNLGKGDKREVTGFFVTTRVRMGYEGNSGMVSAPEWVEAGMPELEFGQNVFGVTDLEILELGSGRFRATYNKWVPGSSDEVDLESTEVIPPEGVEITDLLTLEEQKKGNWLITGLDRTIRDIP
ncbi:MAG: hypothetical protein PQJ50_07405 [Spirochaetales bacterium]|nr:hypothetical protein [Spirochaetales bacterium]